MVHVPVQQHRKVLGMRPILYLFDFLIPYIDLYTEEQMKEVFLGIQGMLKQHEVELFINPNLSANQMHQVRLAIEEGLPYDFVKMLAIPEISWFYIRSLRHIMKSNPQILNVHISQITPYPNPSKPKTPLQTGSQ